MLMEGVRHFLYAQEMSRAGVQVISGLAAGIDGRAHSGALEGGTPTFAVLGSGVDICYPKQHDSLYRQVWQSGGLISEKSRERCRWAVIFRQETGLSVDWLMWCWS